MKTLKNLAWLGPRSMSLPAILFLYEVAGVQLTLRHNLTLRSFGVYEYLHLQTLDEVARRWLWP